MRIIVINFQPHSLSFLVIVDDLAIARKCTCVDIVIELATIAGGHKEISRQVSLNEQRQVFAVAIEFKIRIQLGNLNPSIQIGSRKEITRLVNPDEFGVLFACFLQAGVDQLHCSAGLDRINDQLQIASPSIERAIVLCLAGGSKAPKLGLWAVLNVALPGFGINGSKAQAEKGTWASLACRQRENQGALAKLGVAVGESQQIRHGSVSVGDLRILAGREGQAGWPCCKP